MKYKMRNAQGEWECFTPEDIERIREGDNMGKILTDFFIGRDKERREERVEVMFDYEEELGKRLKTLMDLLNTPNINQATIDSTNEAIQYTLKQIRQPLMQIKADK